MSDAEFSPGAIVWTISYKSTRGAPEQPTGIRASSMHGAWVAFVAWRATHLPGDYYQATAEVVQ